MPKAPHLYSKNEEYWKNTYILVLYFNHTANFNTNVAPSTLFMTMIFQFANSRNKRYCDLQNCAMIKGNASLVENVNSYILAPLSQNSKMLDFDANPITIGYLVIEL